MLQPFDYQNLAIDQLVQHAGQGKKRLLLCMLMGAGKAQPLQSSVLTPEGWKQMGRLSIGDEVINPCGGTSRIIGIYPQGVMKTVRVTFRDGTSTKCTEDHLWQVNRPHRKYGGLPSTVLSVRQLLDDGLFDSAGNAKWFIPIVSPVEFRTTAAPPIDPYLLGVLLGDGGLKYTPTLSSVDEEICAAVRQTLPAGVSLKKQPGPNCDFYISSNATSGAKRNPLKQQLADLGLYGCGSGSKFIPKRYLFGTAPERHALLQGLLDTDGSTTDKATIEYTTISPRLAQEFVELVQSLGGTATCRTRRTKYHYKGERRTGKTSYRVHFKLPSHITPFRLNRKALRHAACSKYPPSRAIVSIEDAGSAECQCIAVDSVEQLYVTDHYIVTHNTLTALELMRRCVEKGKRCLFICDRRMLVEQAVERAREHGLDAGIILARRGRDLDAPCQFASKQTIESWVSKGNFELPPFDLGFIDECHRGVTYQILLFAKYSRAIWIGLSATPCLGNGSGMGAYYDALVQPIQPSRLKELGRIVPVRAFAPHIPDLKGVKSGKDGDYSAKSLSQRMTRDNLVGDVTGWWKKLAEDRPSIYFCCDVRHGLAVRDEFIAAGVSADIIADATPDLEREDIQRRSKNGSLSVVVNCDVLAEGVDWPWVSCVGLVRPTKRLRRYLQMVGRGMRADDGKKDCIIIDHAGCVLYHGFPDIDREWPLSASDNADKFNQERQAGQPASIQCSQCMALFQGTRKCPECGHLHVPTVLPRHHGQQNGTLVEVANGTIEPELAKTFMQRHWGACIGTAIKRRRPAAMAIGMFKSKFGITPWQAGVTPLADNWKMDAYDAFPTYRKNKERPQ